MRKCLGLGVVLWLAASAGWAVDWKSLQAEGLRQRFRRCRRSRQQSASGSLCGPIAANHRRADRPGHDPHAPRRTPGRCRHAIARAWGVGQKGANDGILLLLAIQDRRSRLEIGYGAWRRFCPAAWMAASCAKCGRRCALAAVRRGHDGCRRDARRRSGARQARPLHRHACRATCGLSLQFLPWPVVVGLGSCSNWPSWDFCGPTRCGARAAAGAPSAGQRSSDLFAGCWFPPRARTAAAVSAASIPATVSAASAAAISEAAAPPAIGECPMHEKALTQLVEKLRKALRRAPRLGGAVRFGRHRRPPSPVFRPQRALRADARSRPRELAASGERFPLVARAGQPLAAAADRGRGGYLHRLFRHRIPRHPGRITACWTAAT